MAQSQQAYHGWSFFFKHAFFSEEICANAGISVLIIVLIIIIYSSTWLILIQLIMVVWTL